MFDGLTSRWTTPCACAWDSASHSAIAIVDDVAVRQAPLLEHPVERRATDQLGDEIRALIVHRRLVQGHDSRVREPRGCARLAFKAPADDAFPGHDLDRDVALEALVAGHPDRAERPCAETPLQVVATERRAAPARSCPTHVPARCRRAERLAAGSGSPQRFSTPRVPSLPGSLARTLARLHIPPPRRSY